jgi:curved DNA-binding protein CbpA
MAGQEEDLYLVLGLEKGLESTEADVKKAYRKKALESHPDKRPNDKNAASDFNRIQKAYEVLGDEKARKAYDELRKVQRARADRDAQKGAKRQKMMDDLKRREETFQHERSAEELAKMKLKAEVIEHFKLRRIDSLFGKIAQDGSCQLVLSKKSCFGSRLLDMTKTELKAEVNTQLRRFNSLLGTEREGEWQMANDASACGCHVT